MSHANAVFPVSVHISYANPDHVLFQSCQLCQFRVNVCVTCVVGLPCIVDLARRLIRGQR